MLMPGRSSTASSTWRLTGAAKGGTTVTFGDFGIQALEPGWLTARQIEAARIAMTRHVKRVASVDPVFPDKPSPRSRRDPHGLGKATRALGGRRAPGRVLFELPESTASWPSPP